VRRAVAELPMPVVVDADGLNSLAGVAGPPRALPALRVFTPHPGEMARLTGLSNAEVNADRLGVARRYAEERGVMLVLKGQRTIVAMPGGEAWINPTGTPAMGTGGTGDVLTGMIAGFLAQFPAQPDAAVIAAVYLHGLAGERAAAALGEQCVIAGDLLRFLPEAMNACRHTPYVF
jgi:ADP-dependent NAD(P)H-hydrate dehydratase / NAD(P)H-hydrate epimerase